MKNFPGKRTVRKLTVLSMLTLGLAGCTTLDWLFDAPPEQTASAPVENRTTNKDLDPVAPPVAHQKFKTAPDAGEIRSLLSAWRDAWASRDTQTYLSFYLPSFKGSESSPEHWRAKRKRIISHARQINLSISPPEVILDAPDHATATFKQKYNANNKSDSGTKTLLLRKYESRWLIEQEVFVAAGNGK